MAFLAIACFLLSIPLNPLGKKSSAPGNDFRRARTTVNADNTP